MVAFSKIVNAVVVVGIVSVNAVQPASQNNLSSLNRHGQHRHGGVLGMLQRKNNAVRAGNTSNVLLPVKPAAALKTAEQTRAEFEKTASEGVNSSLDLDQKTKVEMMAGEDVNVNDPKYDQVIEKDAVEHCGASTTDTASVTNSVMSEDQQQIGDDSAASGESTYYTLEQLQNLKRDDPPVGVDVTKLESYLSEAEFESVFGMSKQDFGSLANWKRDAAKKKHRIF